MTRDAMRAAGPSHDRLFVALWPGNDARAQLVSWQAAHRWPPDVRLTPPQDLHLNLHFIGLAAPARLREIVYGLVLPVPTIAFDLDGASLFRHGLAVMVPSRPPDTLLCLHADLATALRRLNLAVESRAFSPHVTLARRAEGTLPPAEVIAPVQWRSQPYVLAARDGAHYRVLHRYAGETG